MLRRSFLALSAAAPFSAAVAQSRFALARTVAEWPFTASRPHASPDELEVDVVFRGPSGEHRVPAYWAGGSEWRVRFAAPAPGRYNYATVCSDPADTGLHGRTGTLDTAPYNGANPLVLQGAPRVASDRRHFEHEDGTPFFWLADTWWMGLCQRFQWPADFQQLTADRAAKGFTVVQIVAGLYPDMPAFDPRGANEAGFPWEKDYARINPAYFDMADLRIQHLVSRGLVSCIVGCWGYFLQWMGATKMKRHWRYLVARWGAYPVVWCLAGEGAMPYYLSTAKERDSAEQKQGWTELARYVRSVDPYRRLITIHPSRSARECVADPSVLDFDMLQTGHGDRQSAPNTVRTLTASYAAQPRMPVIDGEVCYEGIMEASRQEVQRFYFWACVLSGAAGHTYGANGIWQVNRREQPFGPSPHGRSWGDIPWEEAARLPGATHIARSKALLMRYPWWRFEPHPEWVDPHWDEKNYWMPFAAGIPGELRVIFLPTLWNPPQVKSLEPGAWRGFFFDPRTGRDIPIPEVAPDASGTWQSPIPPVVADWVLVLDRPKG
ncbi:MAG: DUF4038 domain-containing protein [Candidatus Solibacter sp.]